MSEDEVMDDDRLGSAPLYRAGVLMGRQQAVTDVLRLLLDLQVGDPSTKARLTDWCVQTELEGRAEMEFIVASIGANDA